MPWQTAFADLERATEKFFGNLRPGSTVVFDHVSFPFGALVLKEFFEYLSTYPLFDSSLLVQGGGGGRGEQLQLQVSLVVITREVERVEAVFASPWVDLAELQAASLGRLSSVHCHHLPLATIREARQVASAPSSSSSSSPPPSVADLESVIQVFGGLCGNVREVLRLGEAVNLNLS